MFNKNSMLDYIKYNYIKIPTKTTEHNKSDTC